MDLPIFDDWGVLWFYGSTMLNGGNPRRETPLGIRASLRTFKKESPKMLEQTVRVGVRVQACTRTDRAVRNKVPKVGPIQGGQFKGPKFRTLFSGVRVRGVRVRP